MIAVSRDGEQWTVLPDPLKGKPWGWSDEWAWEPGRGGYALGDYRMYVNAEHKHIGATVYHGSSYWPLWSICEDANGMLGWAKGGPTRTAPIGNHADWKRWQELAPKPDLANVAAIAVGQRVRFNARRELVPAGPDEKAHGIVAEPEWSPMSKVDEMQAAVQMHKRRVMAHTCNIPPALLGPCGDMVNPWWRRHKGRGPITREAVEDLRHKPDVQEHLAVCEGFGSERLPEWVVVAMDCLSDWGKWPWDLEDEHAADLALVDDSLCGDA